MKARSLLKNNTLGWIEIVEEKDGISEINFLGDNIFICNENESLLTKECKKQLEEYFLGKRKKFNIKLDIVGTEFQKKCWNALLKIPYGNTISYSEEAEMIENKKAVRAVGLANGKNKIPIVIPCHRVIGKNGKLVGYSAGIDIKNYLLNLEKLYND